MALAVAVVARDDAVATFDEGLPVVDGVRVPPALAPPGALQTDYAHGEALALPEPVAWLEGVVGAAGAFDAGLQARLRGATDDDQRALPVPRVFSRDWRL